MKVKVLANEVCVIVTAILNFLIFLISWNMIMMGIAIPDMKNLICGGAGIVIGLLIFVWAVYPEYKKILFSESEHE
jgi:hypothetical protein